MSNRGNKKKIGWEAVVPIILIDDGGEEVQN